VFPTDDSLLLRLSAAPLLYYRTAADGVHQSVPFDLLDDDDDDPWIRITDITTSGAIGRCWMYRVSFKTWFWPKMKDALAYMKEKRVPAVVCDVGWPGFRVHDEPEFGKPMQDLFLCVQHVEELQFPVLFLVNVLVHKGIVNEHQLTSKFFSLLKREEEHVNVAALTELLGENSQVLDVCWRLKNVQDRVAKNPKLIHPRSRGKVAGDYNAVVRRLVITPTRAYCMPPQVERSNRVIRHYHHVADRFLRVTFMDEGMQLLNINALNFHAAPIVQSLMSKSFQHKTTIYRRVHTLMTKGFHLCGRKYSFLAFSSNQMKDRSAWFFAENGTITAATIREWMGQFPSRNVAKHAARMGLCFTSSYATVVTEPNEVNELLEDIERNGYNFSDGIGKITPDLAIEVAARLPLTDRYPPSAYQIRYAGFKGVIAVWPGQNDGIRLSLRPSMRKFESTHSVIEVVSWTKFQPAFLNRQIIILLISLGVPEAIFWEMQEEMLKNLDRILSNREIAYQVVTNSCPEHGTIARLMLSAGFSPATEPHLKAMLLAIKSSQLKGLLKKTKIFVPKGRWLMGCLDELGILEQGQCFIQASSLSINNHFIKHGSRFSSANKNAVTIVGTVVVAKNPCLHPGDVRVLEAVDVPELHHLVDCLVFPKKGERPHANEASGSDLDGDVYFVTWDKNLVPPGKRSWKPMDYSPAEAKQLQRRVLQHVSSTTLCTCTRFFHKMFVQLDVFTVNSMFLLLVHGFSVVLCFMFLIAENIYLAMP
jgi:RNA-dependent RNA polymerase